MKWSELSALSDERWHEMLVRSVKTSVVDGLSMPRFPDQQLQIQIVGSAGETALNEGSRFFKYVKSQCAALGNPLARKTNLLDFGVGWGRMLRFFLKDIDRTGLYAVDAAPDMIETCRETGVPACLAVIDPLGELPFRDRFFDVVYAYSVFTHLPEPAQSKWLGEIARCLKPGGILVATVQSPSFLDFVLSLDESKATHVWHHRMMAAVREIPDIRETFSRDGYAHIRTRTAFLGGGREDVYGDCVMSEHYIRRAWGRFFNVRSYLDDRTQLSQAAVVAVNHLAK